MRNLRRLLRSGPLVPVAFAAWTLFVWVGRLRNLATDPAPAGRLTVAGVVVFVALGVVLGAVLAVSLVRGRSTGSWRRDARVPVLALASVTTVVWLVRAVEIAFDDHPVGFIVVHVVLAVVSIALAVGSVLAVRASSAGSPTPPGSHDHDDGERAAVGYPRSDG